MELPVRKLIITDAIRKANGRRTVADVLAEANEITVPNIVNEILLARNARDYTLACALSLDMLVCRMREIRMNRERYLTERKRAMDAGHTGDVIEVEVRWDAMLGADGCEAVVISKAQRMVAETLLGMYRDADGSMGKSEWRAKADAIMEELTASLSERIIESTEGKVDFVMLGKEELDEVSKAWISGLEDASSRIDDDERAARNSGAKRTIRKE